MKILISSFVMLIVLSACEPFKIKINEIPDEKKPVLQNNDTVCFVNNINNALIDTFMVSRSDEYLMYDRSNFWERINLKYTITNKQSKRRKLYVFLDGETKFVIYGYIPSNGYKILDINLDGIKYPTFCVKNTYPKTSTMPDSIYYSYQEGILRYYHSDTIYHQISKF
ncbi:MAG TPA: hypothetical protein PKX15_09105 [Bacteroidales bacterium]|nr:hypothetical protein [Bacteroidales bacterium]